MCCGQKRSELRSSQTLRTAQSAPKTFSANTQAHAVQTQTSAPQAKPASWPYHPTNPQTGNNQPRVEMTTSTPHSSISIRYLENSPIRVLGLVSGMSYEFSGAAPIRQVDARDASSLLSTRFFRRA